jgi:hypothetical protein
LENIPTEDLHTYIEKPILKIQFFKNQYLIIYISLIISIIGLGILFKDNLFSKTKKFEVDDCTSCTISPTGNRECNRKMYLKYFIIEGSKIIAYGKNNDGQIFINEYPSENEKCIFKINGKYSFACSSTSSTEFTKIESDKEFDGESIFKSTMRSYFIVSGIPKLALNTEATCTMKN